MTAEEIREVAKDIILKVKEITRPLASNYFILSLVNTYKKN